MISAMPLPDPAIDIRAMTAADVAPAADIIAATGWGARLAWFDHAVAAPNIHAAVATDDELGIVGTGVATLHGPVAWIGTIWVHPDRRRRGLGLALTNWTIDVAEGAGCRTLVLVASDEGRPLYERLGFSDLTFEPVLEAPGLPAAADRPGDVAVASGSGPGRRVRAWRAEDLPAALALDLAATGEDRSAGFRAFADPSTAIVVVGQDDVPRGFLIRAPWGGGATIAPDPDDAMALLTARRRASGPDKRVRAGLMASNTVGLERLAAAGWTEAWRARRMSRGEPLDWQPDAIWGQFNHAMG